MFKIIALNQLDTFTSIFTKKFMISLISRVRHYLTITLRSPADNRGFFYLNKDFIVQLHIPIQHAYNIICILFQY
ncbi:hypothetical protein CN425_25430 [Bacillus cereus]|uniref:Uncharacterized protein n=1 Tax=Bacillus cereus TaxID=1396 RepID=A0A2A8PPK3_BACCE|nr:hypothetical protein CON38_26905 [Bacillus cereus]PEV96183.1 hypothetical protein CN425_25430 [Bacillus cereus]